MFRLNLLDADTINLLVRAITIPFLCATVLTVIAISVNQFLSTMRVIAEEMIRNDKNASESNKFINHKDLQCRDCDKKGHLARRIVGTQIIHLCMRIARPRVIRSQNI